MQCELVVYHFFLIKGFPHKFVHITVETTVLSTSYVDSCKSKKEERYLNFSYVV